MPSSRASSQPRDPMGVSYVSCTGGGVPTTSPPWDMESLAGAHAPLQYVASDCLTKPGAQEARKKEDNC